MLDVEIVACMFGILVTVLAISRLPLAEFTLDLGGID